jgi:hypothetical protein
LTEDQQVYVNGQTGIFIREMKIKPQLMRHHPTPVILAILGRLTITSVE